MLRWQPMSLINKCNSDCLSNCFNKLLQQELENILPEHLKTLALETCDFLFVKQKNCIFGIRPISVHNHMSQKKVCSLVNVRLFSKNYGSVCCFFANLEIFLRMLIWKNASKYRISGIFATAEQSSHISQIVNQQLSPVEIVAMTVGAFSFFFICGN